MTEKHSVLERLARAAHSDDLSHRRGLCDVDYMHGLGMVGQRQQQGAALLDLHMTLEPAAAREALQVAMKVTREVAQRRGFSMPKLKERRVAGEALAMYLHPACTACKGRGMLGVDRSKPAEYRPHVCTTCGGSGKRPAPLKHRREIIEVLCILESRLRSAMASVRKAMQVSAPLE